MAAFDPIKSGIPEMDKALDNIRLGDNVVWRVSDLSQFRLFMEPYLKQAMSMMYPAGNVKSTTMRPTSIC